MCRLTMADNNRHIWLGIQHAPPIVFLSNNHPLMQRQVEPELMTEAEQARAYASADFSEPHDNFVRLCQARFPGETFAGPVLDLGCGPGDVMFRFASAFPATHVVGVDGSEAMLICGREALQRRKEFQGHIEFIRGYIPGAPIPRMEYRAVISNSLLHHLHHPEALWQTVCEQAKPGCAIYIVDLARPSSDADAQRLTEENTVGEPEVLRRDFYNSLLAAFTTDEVRNQLKAFQLEYLSVEQVSNRHMVVHGRRRG